MICGSVDHNRGQLEVVRVDLDFYRFRNGFTGGGFRAGQVVLLTELIDRNLLRGGRFWAGFWSWFFYNRLRFGWCRLGGRFFNNRLRLGRCRFGHRLLHHWFWGVGRTCGTGGGEVEASSKTCMTSGFCSQLGINPYTSRPRAKAIWQISAIRKICPSLWFIPNIIFYPAPIITIPRHHHLDDNALELAGR